MTEAAADADADAEAGGGGVTVDAVDAEGVDVALDTEETEGPAVVVVTIGGGVSASTFERARYVITPPASASSERAPMAMATTGADLDDVRGGSTIVGDSRP